MWCPDIILLNAEQVRRNAEGAMLEISEPEGAPTCSITWVCTLLNHCIAI